MLFQLFLQDIFTMTHSLITLKNCCRDSVEVALEEDAPGLIQVFVSFLLLLHEKLSDMMHPVILPVRSFHNRDYWIEA